MAYGSKGCGRTRVNHPILPCTSELWFQHPITKDTSKQFFVNYCFHNWIHCIRFIGSAGTEGCWLLAFLLEQCMCVMECVCVCVRV